LAALAGQCQQPTIRIRDGPFPVARLYWTEVVFADAILYRQRLTLVQGVLVMQTMPIEQAEGRLSEIVTKLSPDEEIILTRNNQPVARLIGEKRPPRPGPGLCRGMISIVADDDEHLKDFAEYMP
jgi:antitoxin (DNA-binding transcriptional repressor) of toxin-antitoxin stability system